MSECKSHQLGEYRIPSSLIDTYVQYKKDTRAIIAWLLSHGTSRYKQIRTLSIDDLFGLAKIAQTKPVEMPGTIDFHFREAIAARAQLSKWYRRVHDHYGSDDQDTCNHEHFTSCLVKIYADLCDHCGKPKDKCKRSNRTSKTPDDTNIAPNRFLPLVLDHGDDSSPSDDMPLDYQSQASSIGDQTTISNGPRLRLCDDSLGEAFELRKDVQEMHDLLTATQSTWEQAARGELSLVVATFTTQIAFTKFEEIEARLTTSCGVSDPGCLRRRYMQMEQDLGEQMVDENESESPAKQMIEGLRESWLLLVNAKLEGSKAMHVQSNSQLTIRRGPNSVSKDKECHAMILMEIGQHIQSGVLHNDIVRIASPVYTEVGYYLTRGEDDYNNTHRCSFGLALLLTSYKGYLMGSPSPAASSTCRLKALKFAQQAVPHIRAVLDDSTMPCRCPDTLARYLDNIHMEFQSFLQIRIFDFYFQSPWVSGSHMLEMLHTLFCAGLRVFNYKRYVISVLHVYNMLRQFTNIPILPLLEDLSESPLSEIIFPGGLPDQNFKSCYTRSLGGRLRFSSYHHKEHRKSGAMTIPVHAAKATNGFTSTTKCEADNDPRFDIQKISLFHHIRNKGYHPGKATWKQVYELSHANHEANGSTSGDVNKEYLPTQQKAKAVKKGTCSHHHRPDHRSSCPAQRLSDLQSVVQGDFTGRLPVAKINFFAIYLVCVRIVSRISDEHHSNEATPGQKCLCFVDEILSSADRCRDDEKCPFWYKGLGDSCKKAMVEELEGKGVEEFLWNGL